MGAIFADQGGAVVHFDADGSRTVFPFAFDVFETGDLRITLDGDVVTTGFHVALFDPQEQAGGEVRFKTAPAAGGTVTISRMLRLRRLSAYGLSVVPRGDAVDRDLDYLTAALGDVDRAMDGVLHLDPDDRGQAGVKLPRSMAGRSGPFMPCRGGVTRSN